MENCEKIYPKLAKKFIIERKCTTRGTPHTSNVPRNTRAARELMEIDFEGIREPYSFNLSVIKRSSLSLLSPPDAFDARPMIEIYLLDRFPITRQRYRNVQ